MIAVFSLEWQDGEKFNGLSEEDKAAFVSSYGEWENSYTQYFGDPTLAMRLFGGVKLKRILTCEYTERMQDILARLERIPRMIENDRTMNEKCNVHIGGHSLMQINETILLENSCTDALQNELDAGWRIVAACVQPDGRRPDYILGRYNAGKDK